MANRSGVPVLMVVVMGVSSLSHSNSPKSVVVVDRFPAETRSGQSTTLPAALGMHLHGRKSEG